MRLPRAIGKMLYLPVARVMAPELRPALRRLRSSESWTEEAIDELRAQRLRSLLEHARSHVPFYRANVVAETVARVSNVEDISRFPLIKKSQLQRRPADFTSENPGRFLTRKTTGGSTGEPLTILKTRHAMSWELAATWRGYAWAGVEIGDRQARFWGIPRDTRARQRAKWVDFIGNRRRFSAFSFNDESMRRYDQILESFQPHYFYGYVSMLTQFAEYYQREGRAPRYELKCIVSTSEVLTQDHRNLLQGVFGAPVFNEYGCGELGTIAHECRQGRLHISAENMIVEILNGDRPTKDGEVGELVITELNNHAMPLIRYRTGDYAVKGRQACACGRSLEVLDGLHGRAYDMLRAPDGRVFHAEFMMYIFEDAKRKDLGIRQFQVRQLDLDRFEVRVVRGNGYGPATEEFIVGRIREAFGEGIRVDFVAVQEIPREPSGKLRVIVGLGD